MKIEQVIYFKYKNMLHNISELSSGAVRSKFNILYDFHELEGLHPCGSGLQPLDNQHFGLRVNLRHVVRGQVAVDVKVWCTGVLFIHTQELIDQ